MLPTPQSSKSLPRIETMPVRTSMCACIHSSGFAGGNKSHQTSRGDVRQGMAGRVRNSPTCTSTGKDKAKLALLLSRSPIEIIWILQ